MKTSNSSSLAVFNTVITKSFGMCENNAKSLSSSLVLLCQCIIILVNGSKIAYIE